MSSEECDQVDTTGWGLQKMVPPDGTIFQMVSKSIERNIVMNCLKIIAEKGGYESHSMAAFKKIAEVYGIDVSYTEMLTLSMIDKDMK